MAERDPAVPQSDDQDLQADLVRLLQIVGPLGRFNVADIIVPVVSMGDVVTRTIESRTRAFRSSEVFTEGRQTAAPLFTLHADTGPALTAGIYDLMVHIAACNTPNTPWDIEHRDAANAATVVSWNANTTNQGGVGLDQSFAYEFALNERLRIRNALAIGVGIFSAAVIFARLRT